jgi:saccharopine dehydrogenase-like NADP-dependent oxidoreductase
MADPKSSGGSILTDFLSREAGPISTTSIFATVRSTEQAQRLSKLHGVHVLQLELTDQAAVRDAVLKNEIDIVLNLAGWDLEMSKSFIDALGERKQASGSQTCFVQVSPFPASESIRKS